MEQRDKLTHYRQLSVVATRASRHVTATIRFSTNETTQSVALPGATTQAHLISPLLMGVGDQFPPDWKPRVVLQYDPASGYNIRTRALERFDSLLGAWRE